MLWRLPLRTLLSMEQRNGKDVEWPIVAVASTSASSSSSSTTVAVGSTSTSSAVDSTLGLFVVTTLGSTVFFSALRCLRKVAPMIVVRWTNSDEGKCSNSMNSKILPRQTGKKRRFLELFLWTSSIVWMKRERKHMGPPVMKVYRKMHLSIGMVCAWEIWKMLWQAILNR